MSEHQQTNSTTPDQKVSDAQLKALGLEPISAWKIKEAPVGKQKNAARQKKFRETAAKNGLIPCSLGLVPKAEAERLKAIAKQLREQNIPLTDALSGIIPAKVEIHEKIVEVEKVIKVKMKLSPDQTRVLRTLATGAWRAKAIRWLAGCSL